MKEQSNNEVINKLLELSKKEKRVKQKQRYDTVILFLEGHSNKEISSIFHIPKRTINYHTINEQISFSLCELYKKHI